MSCFSQSATVFQLSDQWTADGEFAWLHSLLSYADQYNAGGGDPSPNPFTATILRPGICGHQPEHAAAAFASCSFLRK